MADRIETIDELRNALAAAVKAGTFDVRVEVRDVHKTFDVADKVSNLEIHNSIYALMRLGDKPEVVFILGGGQVVGQIHVLVDGDCTVEDKLWRVAGDVSVLQGGKVWLTPAPSSAYGLGILEAFRMPWRLRSERLAAGRTLRRRVRQVPAVPGESGSLRHGPASQPIGEVDRSADAIDALRRLGDMLRGRGWQPSDAQVANWHGCWPTTCRLGSADPRVNGSGVIDGAGRTETCETE